jgi:glycosyltransferase involved in cell wall biosynthesis
MYIVVKLSGGLGNQIFQWLFGKSIALENGANLIFDTSEFNSNNLRELLLPFLCKDDLFSSFSKKFNSKNEKDLVTISRSELGIKTLKNLSVIRENRITYQPIPKIEVGASYYLIGYWQSYKYWDKYKYLLKEIILSLESYLKKFPEIYKRILPPQDLNTCAIHIRRGDYLSKVNLEYHGLCQIEYFRSAMKLSGATKFHIYTDDISFVEQNLVGENVQIITDPKLTELLDFMNLTRYKKLIISNSSYSYLAAMIADSGESKIIAPSRWYYFTDTGPDIPKDWIKLNRSNGRNSNEEIHLVKTATISVVIPIYDRIEYLDRAINTCINQSHKPLEIIVSLNGSRDKIAEDVYKIASRYQREGVKVIKIPIASLSKARNNGIVNAQSEYIAFLDDDDVWDKNKLDLQIKASIANDADIVSCNFYQFNDDAITLKEGHLREDPTKSWANRLSIENCLSGGSAVLAKKECLISCGLFDESMPSCEDHDMWRRIAIAGYKIFFIPQTLVGYQIHKKNMTKDLNRMLVGEIIHFSKIISSGEKYRHEAKAFHFSLEKKISFVLENEFIEKSFDPIIITHINSIIFDSSKRAELLELLKTKIFSGKTIKSKITTKLTYYFLFLPAFKLGLFLSKWLFGKK